MPNMDRREGARILRETVTLLEALEEGIKRASIPNAVIERLTDMRSGLEGVAERLAEDEARDGEGKSEDQP